jgi:putative hydrolase of the HAD superfamily
MSHSPPECTLILFDLGLVVVDVELSIGRAVWQALTGREGGEFDRVFFDSGIKYHMDIGELSAQDAIAAACKLTEGQVSPEIIESCWNAVLTARPEVSRAICKLSQDYRCDVLSNTDPIHAKWIQEQCGIMEAITHWTFSFDSGHMKPQRPLFEVALKAADVPAEEALLVDDRSDNIATAKALGMDTIWVNDEEQVLAELRARGFDIHS